MGQRVGVLLVAASFVTLTACPKPGGGPAAGASAGPVMGGANELTLTVTVKPADAEGTRAASVKFEATAPMKEGQLAFEVPAGCTVQAGALVRPVKSLTPDQPVSQELTFRCDPATGGALKVKYTGTDGQGQPFEKTAEGAL